MNRLHIRRLFLVTFPCIYIIYILYKYNPRSPKALLFEISFKNIEQLISEQNSTIFEASGYHQKKLRECKSFKTSTKFPTSLEENLSVVKKYNFTVPQKYLKSLELDSIGIKSLINRKKNNSMYPLIFSGISDNHFQEWVGLLNSIKDPVRKKFPDIKMVMFDLGLSKEHRMDVENMCKCDVRQFPFDKYPPHIKNLKGYTWKPIILQMMLQENDFVLWVDSPVRLKKNVDELFDKTYNRGIQVLQGTGSIAVRTQTRLFDLLKEKPCMFNYPEVQGGFVVIKRSAFTLEAVMHPWVSCALQYGCMDFPKSEQFLECIDGSKLSSCHRFDQAVLGIILTRYFNIKRNFVTFRDGEYGFLCYECKDKLNDNV